MWDTYLKNDCIDLKVKLFFGFILLYGVLQILSGVKILHGYPRWVALMISLFAFCLVLDIPVIVYQPNLGFYAFTLCLPLMGLYCLNSDLYRQMLKAAERNRMAKTAGIKPRVETLRHETATNHLRRSKTRRSVIKSKHGIMLVKLVCWIISLFSAVVLVLKLFLIYKGIVSGVVAGAGRYGPPKTYSLGDEPWMFGLSMLLHLLAVCACGLFLKLMLLLRE